MIYFKKKNFHLSEEPILKFINTKVKKKIETPQNKEKSFSKNSLRYLLPIQNYMKHCQLKKSLDPIAESSRSAR